MNVLGFLRCLLLPHQPDRQQVRKRGKDHYVGYCRHCGTRIRRIEHNHWKRYWGAPSHKADDD